MDEDELVSETGKNDAAERFPVVCVGASAGGVEAFSEFLGGLSPKLGMAFILVLHMSQDTKSILAQILARTSRLPVVEAAHGMAVEKDHVYVMPSARDMTISGRALRLTPRTAPPGRHLPIDGFMRSLAQDQGPWSIGVVLTGADGDGMVGLSAIRSEGGVTFAQAPETAAYPSMPAHAVTAGVADYVLPIEGIVAKLTELAEDSYLARRQRVLDSRVPTDQLYPILEVLRQRKGVDFYHYKEASLRRRLSRRLALLRIDTLEEYAAHISAHPEEADRLYQDLLIMVTEFFREPEVFEALKRDVFPRLKETNPQELRFWVVGCSTGQEAYSLAMAVTEFFEHQQAPPIQIFATDVNEQDIVLARAGLYPASIVNEIPDTRLRRFFNHVAIGYEVKKQIRDLCVFARHDVTRDPPFTRLDLITCRNVLIYFNATLQDRVIPALHYGLRPTGFLLLGAAESVGKHTDRFEALGTKHRIYRKLPVQAALPVEFAYPGLTAGTVLALGQKPGHVTSPLEPTSSVAREADRLIASRYAPASVVVDEQLHVEQFRGDTGRYILHPSGEATFDLLLIVKEGLRAGVREALEEARTSGRRAQAPGELRNGTPTRVALDVIPFRTRDDRLHFVVSFSEQDAPRRETVAERPPEGEVQVLRRELDATRDRLQSVIVGKESANEELIGAYEELQSSNEELKSVNEELETAKEELQSINEELETVNAELQRRNEELGRAHDDLNNLLLSSNIPLFMLDTNLRIRQYTPGAERLLKLLPSDVGRPLTDLRMRVDVPDLEELILTTIRTVEPLEREVEDNRHRWYSMRIRPYLTADKRMAGAVLTFFDITSVKRELDQAAEAARLGEARSQIGEAAISALEPEEIIREVMTRAARALQTESALLAKTTNAHWTIEEQIGLSAAMKGLELTDEEFGFAAGPRRTKVLARGSRTLSPGGPYPSFLTERGAHVSLAVPLVATGKVTHVLVFSHHQEGRDFSSRELDFVEKLTALMSLSVANTRLRRAEHQMADALRDQLRPEVPSIAGFDIGYAWHQAADVEQVGGDLVDAARYGSMAYIFVGDAAGHGLSATRLVQRLQTAVQTLAHASFPPDRIFSEVGDILRRSRREMTDIATAALVAVDVRTGRGVYANAGHPRPIRCGASCEALEVSHGVPLGADTARSYEPAAIKLDPGDTLVLYTDGILEARNETGFFGEERLMALVAEGVATRPQQLAESILAAAAAFAHGDLADDALVLVARYQGESLQED